MRRFLVAFLFLGLIGLKASHAKHDKNPVDYVNILMGTQSTFALSNGNTYPAIALPWGMNFWSPQTGKMGDGWMYSYTDNKLRGFKQTHQPSPWMNDYGQFSIMPTVGDPTFDQDDRASWFSHKAEVAKPHYYSVYLADYDVTTEITPTERAAFFRFTFPDTEQAQVVIDAFDRGSYVQVIPEENKIVGYTTRNSGGVPDNFKNYFVIVFDRPFDQVSSFADSLLVQDRLEVEANHVGAIVGFSIANRGDQVSARVASSFISHEQAERNLAEIGKRTFEEVKQAGEARRPHWPEPPGLDQVTPVGDYARRASPQAVVCGSAASRRPPRRRSSWTYRSERTRRQTCKKGPRSAPGALF